MGRCLPKARSHERLRSTEYPALRRKTISSPTSEINSPRSSYNSHKKPLTRLGDPEKKEAPLNRINSFPNRHRNEIDRIDENYHQNRTAASNSSVCRVSEEDLSYTEVGLSLPNYYPDSKCDTDASLTDNISVEGKLEESVKSCKRSGKAAVEKSEDILGQSDSIPYDDNIILSKNTPLYDSLGDFNYYRQPPPFKPRTIRGNTPYQRSSADYGGVPQSLPNYAISTATIYDSDSSLSDYNLQYYDCEDDKDKTNGAEYVESNTNFDEIKLANDNIKLVHRDKVTENIIYDSKSEESNIENNPVYDEISNASHIKEIDCNTLSGRENSAGNRSLTRRDSNRSKSSVFRWIKSNNNTGSIKTSVRVRAADNELETSSEEYKTVVSIDTDDKASSCFSSKDLSQEKKHSHNYLREFLESQRGSKKPLQNYLSKKISRAFGERNSKSPVDPKPNLLESQYHSLPDISIGKNLRKCEKIDRKLRKCEHLKITKAQTDSTNRFIVNIGRHFDVTAQSNIPVDFEVKISKIPKTHKSKHKNKTAINCNETKEKSFLDAVRTLKETLNAIDENQNITKPEIVAVKTKWDINEEITQINAKQKKDTRNKTSRSNSLRNQENINEISIEKRMEEIRAINQEYQEKVGTIRNYWDKMANEAKEKGEEKPQDEENRCEIVDIQTKVEEVKKKFEQDAETPTQKQHSKVQLAKEIFELKSRNDKNGKMSNFVKECREIFENPYFERDNNNQFESLNPNIVEIIDREEKMKQFQEKETINEETTEKSKSDHDAGNKIHKPVAKSKSITIEPEFDHVRYRVMKSDVFQKKIFANCEKESQFDGLMQYLQDYSFQELLIDNNIVIIEPIRTSIKYEPKKHSRTSRNITQLVHKTKDFANDGSKGVKRHFFYHPIRVNREVNDDELPNPDTVKQVRQFFECGLKKSRSTKDIEDIAKNSQYKEMDPDKDRCSTTTDTNSTRSAMSDYGSNENLFDSLDDLCCEQYISEDILERIRERGTTITYYGGRILNKYNGKSISLTKAIMDEIKRNQKTNECGCRKNSDSGKGITTDENIRSNKNKDQYQGVKFKLLKSNSCSSRLELVGTKNLSEYRNKYLIKQKQLIDEHNKKKQEALKEANHEGNYIETTSINLQSGTDEQKDTDCKVINFVDKNALNENIKQQSEKRSSNQSPKIIGEEMKSTKAIDVSPVGTIDGNLSTSIVTFAQSPPKISYDYSLERVKKIREDDMEFEPYEVAN